MLGLLFCTAAYIFILKLSNKHKLEYMKKNNLNETEYKLHMENKLKSYVPYEPTEYILI
jgi:hypothetical protein